MSDLTIRPTLRFIKAGAVLAALVFLALEVLYLTQWQQDVAAWVMAIPPLILLWPLARYVRWRSESILVTADRLRHETGLLGKSVRTIEISKLQQVNVRQSVRQRMFGVGDIGFETAGQGTWQGMRNIERPQQVADDIMNRAGRPPA